MSSNIFFVKKNIQLQELFPKVQFKKSFLINTVRPLISAQKNDITFFDSLRYKNDITKSKAQICITSQKLEKYLPNDIKKIIVKNVLFELARVTKILYPMADVDFPDLLLKKPNKSNYKKVRFGNNVLVGKNVKIGTNSTIGSNTVIESNVEIGKNCLIGSGVIIKNSIVKNNIVIQDNCKIGQKGFGFIPVKGKRQSLKSKNNIDPIGWSSCTCERASTSTTPNR